MMKTTGEGLDSLAGALIICVLLWFIYKVGAGFVHHIDGYSQAQARCTSISGIYGNGKCYVNGNEMFSGDEE